MEKLKLKAKAAIAWAKQNKLAAIIILVIVGMIITSASKAGTITNVVGPQYVLLFGDRDNPDWENAYICTEPFSVVGDESNTIFINCTVIRKPAPEHFLTCVGKPDEAILECPAPDAEKAKLDTEV